MRLLAIVGAALAVQCVNAGFGHAHPQNPLNGGGKREAVAKREEERRTCENVNCENFARIGRVDLCCMNYKPKREIVAKREEELAPCPQGVPEDSGPPYYWPTKCKRDADVKLEINTEYCKNVNCTETWRTVCCAIFKGKREVVANREEDRSHPQYRKREVVAKRQVLEDKCTGVSCWDGSEHVCCKKFKREEELAREVVAKREEDRSHPFRKREAVAQREDDCSTIDCNWQAHDCCNHKREVVAKREMICKEVICTADNQFDDCCIMYSRKREVVAKSEETYPTRRIVMGKREAVAQFDDECRHVDCSIAHFHVCCGRKREVKRLPAF